MCDLCECVLLYLGFTIQIPLLKMPRVPTVEVPLLKMPRFAIVINIAMSYGPFVTSDRDLTVRCGAGAVIKICWLHDPVLEYGVCIFVDTTLQFTLITVLQYTRIGDNTYHILYICHMLHIHMFMFSSLDLRKLVSIEPLTTTR
jgi:hypothetical protein